MNTVSISIYLCLLQFPSSLFYSFQGRSLSSHWLSLFLSIFYAIINEIALLIFFSGSLLLVYRNATNFYMLIFYQATLLNSFISSNRYFCWWWFFIDDHIICRDDFVSFLFIFISFSSLSCLIALTRTPDTMLNRSSGSGPLCLY